MTVKHDCSGKIWGAYRDVSGRVYPCSRDATIQRNGEWYCWQHDPEHVKADKEKRLAADKAAMDKRHAMYARRTRNARLAELVTPELAALLKWLLRIMKQANVVFYANSRLMAADRLAARIREALALEANSEN